MIKKIFTIFIVASFLLGVSPVFATTTKAPVKKTTVSKKPTAKKTAKKKVVKKKEKLTLQPVKFTVDTAPHSAKPIAKSKKKTTKKVTIKKPSIPSKVVATKKK